MNPSEALLEMAAELAACTACGREHERRIIKDPTLRRPRVTWADPNDGHGYYPNYPTAENMIRRLRERAAELAAERAP
jgi:hypothetical protein